MVANVKQYKAKTLSDIIELLKLNGYEETFDSGIKAYRRSDEHLAVPLKVVYSAELGRYGIFPAVHSGDYTAAHEVPLRRLTHATEDKSYGMMFPNSAMDGTGAAVVRWGTR